MRGEEKTLRLNERIVAAGHVLKLDEDGAVDEFALSVEGHNGPGCSVCGESWCQHCENANIAPCDGGAWKREYEAAQRVREAAPDLLEALQECRDRLAAFMVGQVPPDAIAGQLAKYDAAISRALGQGGEK